MMQTISSSINDPGDLQTTGLVPFFTVILPEGQCEMSSDFIMICSESRRAAERSFSHIREEKVGVADLARDKTLVSLSAACFAFHPKI